MLPLRPNPLTYVGDYLLRKMLEAIPQAKCHKEDFELFDGGLREKRDDDVVSWQKMLYEWEKDYNAPNPYVSSKTSESSGCGFDLHSK